MYTPAFEIFSPLPRECCRKFHWMNTQQYQFKDEDKWPLHLISWSLRDNVQRKFRQWRTIPATSSAFTTNSYQGWSKQWKSNPCPNKVHHMWIWLSSFGWQQFSDTLMEPGAFGAHPTCCRKNKGWEWSLFDLENAVIVVAFLFPLVLLVCLFRGLLDVRGRV